ncbi:putative toxin-antitoxin system toxin component, PIN family [Limnohabitans sp. JirII-31]|uniref:putative toxin-antitoxin system toxin component, PIN family n=1 Tax=Limnohabitans sp. JirII-31 TaxID=1977908 RepID=UPI000C1F860D|nr:putative toxin-antitoxin system toxin component, PIN family [Limnohabitans sp. JirII-31]PIT72571.1 putative toxin-antitoxin system toxin component, PIN family [Limnohabitans sp. JirII-31]
MTSLKLVIDTNVLISAALSTQGAPAKLVQLALAKHRLVFSQATFDELRTRLYRPKFDRFISLESRERLLHDFNACAHWVEIGVPGLYCRDRDDDKMVETALQASAAALISGDKDLLDMVAIPGLQVLSPQQALVFLGA